MQTKVINLFAGPGAGKSTTAAGLFSEMKYANIQVELVTEYVKHWAWVNREIKVLDQLYILAKQSQMESRLYGKVEYLVTDSPILLPPIYEDLYFGTNVTKEAAIRFIDVASKNGATYYNFLLERNKPFHQEGRFQNEDEARRIDRKVKSFLDDNCVEYTTITVPFPESVHVIANALKLNLKERV